MFIVFVEFPSTNPRDDTAADRLLVFVNFADKLNGRRDFLALIVVLCAASLKKEFTEKTLIGTLDVELNKFETILNDVHSLKSRHSGTLHIINYLKNWL